ncbi:MAG: phosphotransferase enzyme family protein [Candidatus Thorarchaeota archaeon]
MSLATEVSYRAVLLRLRKLAQRALEQYGIDNAQLKLQSADGNGIYRVTIPSDSESHQFPPGQYNLRLHQPGYMDPKFIPSEMMWLAALSDAGIPVPKPFRNLSGEWLTVVESEFEVPCSRNCSLISWIDGRAPKNPSLHHMKAVGRVIGRMHEQSISWKPPKEFIRPHWNWEGLYGGGFEYGFVGEETRNTIPRAYQASFTHAIELVKEGMEQLGTGREVYGVIHADFAVDGNVLFHKGEARPIDFDDCGFGYWLFDLGVALAHYFVEIENPIPKMKEALIESYTETTPLTDVNLEYIDLFTVARLAQLIYFYHGTAMVHPQFQESCNRYIKSFGEELKRVLKRIR